MEKTFVVVYNEKEKWQIILMRKEDSNQGITL